MSRDETSASEPLLSGSDGSSTKSYASISQRETQTLVEEGPLEHVNRTLEDDVLPETAAQGRTIGWSSAYILVISRVIGSGIFATPGVIFKSVGSVGLTLVLWVAGAGIAWCGLALALEYSCMLPRSGGHKVWLEFTYRRPRFLTSTLVAVHAVLLGFTASNCIVFSEYIFFALNAEPDLWSQKWLAVSLLTAITITHGCFMKAGVWIQNVLGWIKIALIGLMILTSLYVVAVRGSRPSDVATVHRLKSINAPGLFDDSVWNWGILSTALFKVIYSYAGLENVTNVMNEVKKPVKTLKSASMAGLITSCILYLLINIAYFSVVPADEIKESGELVAALFFERVFGPSVGRTILPTAIALSAASNVMVVTFALARLNQEIARQGFLPFSRILSSSKPFNAPLGGLIVHYIPSLLVITIPTGNVYSFILDVEGYPAQFIALATSTGLIWLRYKRPDLHRPYKAFLPAVGLRIVLALALLAAPFVPRASLNGRSHLYQVTYALVGTSILLFGAVVWVVYFQILPTWKGYQIEERIELLDDGTSVTRLESVPRTVAK